MLNLQFHWLGYAFVFVVVTSHTTSIVKWEMKCIEAMGDDEITQNQRKLLGRLGWLIDRTKLDFKGNAAPFVHSKTKRSVEKSKKRADRSLQGDSDFKTVAHIHVPLSLDATHCRSHVDANAFSTSDFDERHHCRNAFHQVLDSQSGRPEIEEVFRFAGPRESDSIVKGRRRFSQRPASTDGGASSGRPTAKDVATATPQQRLQVLRSDALAHPKFTASSRVTRAGEIWNRSSQLPPNACLSPPPVQRPVLAERRNEIRMVALMRQSQNAAWK